MVELNKEEVKEELVIVTPEEEKTEKESLKVRILSKIRNSADKAIEKEHQPKTKGDKLKKIAVTAGIGLAVGFAAVKAICNKSDSSLEDECTGDSDFREVKTDETESEN